MTTLRGTADAVRAGGSRIVLVTGDAGAGKSSVLARLHRVLEADGWLVAAGRCPEEDGAPPAWAWVQVLRFLAGRVPPGALSGSLAPLLDEDRPVQLATDASSGRFRMRRAVCAWLAAVAAAHPLAVILDDVHRADAETLALLTAAAQELVGVPVLLAATFRPTEVDDRLAEALAVLARRSPQRLPLGGLPLSDVDKIVRIVCPGSVDAATVAALAERTGGNPFYVRESARLLASEGALVAMSEIPKGVRDVLRRRLARLPASVVTVLRLVAVVGRDADVEVVVTAADIDQSDVLDALEVGVAAGLLIEPRPGMVRFGHALVRDTVYADLPHVRRGPMHARVAATIERLKPDDLSALAHHYARAGSSETARRAVDYALRGAEVAERRYAHDAAVLLLTQALDSHERLPAGDGDRDAEWVDIAGRLLRAQVRAGAVAAARATRDRAIDVAAAAGREDLLVKAFTAWTEPTPWMTRPYRTVDERVVAVLERLLRRTDLGPADRCRLLDALVAELAGEGDPRAADASRQAVDLARGVGDPALLALALSEEARAASWDREPDRRAALAEEISRIGTEHGLVAYEWYGEFVSATVAAARGALPALRRHTERGIALAKAYQMAEPVTVGLCSRAMLAHVAGRFDEAERLYAEACTAMAHHGSLHAEDFGTLAKITIRVSQHRMAEFAAADRALDARYGPVAVDVRAAALAAAGRHREARDLLADAPPLRPDLYFSLFATLRAMAIVAVGARGSAEELYAALLPINDQLAGAASTSLAMRPIAYTLGELAQVLGRRADAADHFAHAVAVAQRWQAPHWHAEARENAAR
jgi:tetratricopeptide (TPR) repeat protein